jgi:hypothetical protein
VHHVGEYRESRNAANHEGGGLHLDENAARLGFARGGAVAGSIHLDLFSPVVLELFGKEWFEAGSVSIRYRSPTVDRERVRVNVEGDGAQRRAWIERDDGMVVGEGTVAVGAPNGTSALRSLDLHEHPAGDLRILEGLADGDELPGTRRIVPAARQQALLAESLVTEVLDWHRGDSPWGGAVVVPQLFVHELHRAATAHLDPLVARNGDALGMFGALEIANVRGPLVVDREYDLAVRILALGDSPKAEHAWFEVTATEGDAVVATLFMQQRWLKASSPRYS